MLRIVSSTAYWVTVSYGVINFTVIDLCRKSSECWLRRNTSAFLIVNAHILCLPPLHTCNLLFDDAQSVIELSFVTATNIMPTLSINDNKMNLVYTLTIYLYVPDCIVNGFVTINHCRKEINKKSCNKVCAFNVNNRYKN